VDRNQVFEVPRQDAYTLSVNPGLALEAAANDDVPLRERPPIVVAKGFMITYSRVGILIGGITMAAFTAWSFTHVFLFLAWLSGASALNHHFISLGGLSGVWHAIAGFASGVSILCGGLFVWAFYNWLRFRGPDRRSEPKHITDLIVADHYGLPATHVKNWQYAKWLRAHHDERGVVCGAESDLCTWVRGEEEPHPVIKPNTFDILYLSARSRMWRRKAKSDAVAANSAANSPENEVA
jgi:biofilm PGA synthesis protein PgaD